MRFSFLGLVVAALFAVDASAAPVCSGIRLGYIDQHRPPFYLGNGREESTPPGAAVDLAREMAAAGRCPLTTLRLPSPRIRLALGDGTIDMAALDGEDIDAQKFAYPLDKNGKLDRDRSLSQVVVVFVRAADKLPASTEPASYFKGRTLGINHGARWGAKLREGGIGVDDGAVDAERNLNKVLLGRLDGFAVTLTVAPAMDEFIAAHYGRDIVRLPRPLRTSNSWMAVNKDFYASHRAQVEAMWDWLGAVGRARYPQLQKRYAGN